MAVLEFLIEYADLEDFKNKTVLEVGSKYVNGSVRPFIERFLSPKEYVGIDIEQGKFVDVVLPAEKLVEYFGKESFDVVISTELLEHVKDWRLVITNIKEILKPEGIAYITTRAKGFPYHSFPYDFWRYELEDMKTIFEDFEIVHAEKDREAPGVFLKAKKPKTYIPKKLSDIALHSMVLNRRTKEIPTLEKMAPAVRLIRQVLHSEGRHLLPQTLRLSLQSYANTH